jgi:dihydrofolate reductase
MEYDMKTGKVVLDMTISLDGYIAGPHDEVDWGLFDWQWDSKTNTPKHSATIDEFVKTTGAIIAGRRVYEGVHGWGGNHPIYGVPVFVLTHKAPNPKEVPQGATPFTFVTNGIQSALDQAKTAAGDKDVYVMGGANVAQQYVKAGLLNEIRLHLVPILFGEGIRLFDHIGTEHIRLESAGVSEDNGVIHQRFRIVR